MINTAIVMSTRHTETDKMHIDPLTHCPKGKPTVICKRGFRSTKLMSWSTRSYLVDGVDVLVDVLVDKVDKVLLDEVDSLTEV